jgi:hypothetical protein
MRLTGDEPSRTRDAVPNAVLTEPSDTILQSHFSCNVACMGLRLKMDTAARGHATTLRPWE